MPLKLYFDQHVHKAIATGLRIDVLTAYEDSTSQLDDSALLERANQLGRVLFSQDDDLLAEAALRQRQGQQFGGLIYAHQLRLTVGQCVNDLELIAKLIHQEEADNQIVFLPL
jgi:hypothetical protein